MRAADDKRRFFGHKVVKTFTAGGDFLINISGEKRHEASRKASAKVVNILFIRHEDEAENSVFYRESQGIIRNKGWEKLT